MDNNNVRSGHSLGGGEHCGRSSMLSNDDLRRRRLAALSVGVNNSGANIGIENKNGDIMHNENGEQKLKSSKKTAPVVPLQQTDLGPVAFIDDEDEDSTLQYALRLSLEKQNNNEDDDIVAVVVEGEDSVLSHQQQPQSAEGVIGDVPGPQTMEKWWKSGQAFDIRSFHSFMWDSGLTTDNDKSRWVGQGIDIRAVEENSSSSTSTNSTSCTSPDNQHHHDSNILGENKDENMISPEMFSAVASDHKPWGLTQTHGGPCGVLAAVQAELLRLVLFDKNNPLNDPLLLEKEQQKNPSKTASATKTTGSTDILSEDMIRQGLAKSIATILARAAIMPSAGGSGTSDGNSEEKEERGSSVGIVLPKNYSQSSSLSWNDLEPWNSRSSTNEIHTNLLSETLHVYTISPEVGDTLPSHKRQKTNGGLSSQDARAATLAKSVTKFLLMEFPAMASSNEKGKTEESTINSVTPLDCFRRPGGVLLLVMSLVCSREAQIIQNEMDDPAGSKLTSQFGHCGQELINLLLTGQAVSNVFDNTLTPSGGELICRGIQSRPTIGYLSQLEALRFCEVGGYYKTPKFPIWIVGSTSHFTVLFGHPSCLKETASDVLLEKCRRAFKAVEGGEENGFIASQNLGGVLKSLDINLGSDDAVQTLAATLEVNEANIILWDDFWKATSRLLTGASLDSIFLAQGSGDLNGGLTDSIIRVDNNNITSNTNFGENDMVNANSGKMATQAVGGLLLLNDGKQQFAQDNVDLDTKPPAKLSQQEADEEMAKRLSCEWDYDEQQEKSHHSPAHQQQAARIASPMQVDQGYVGLSDEELARKLQAEWDAEFSRGAGGGNSSVATVDGSTMSSIPSQPWKSSLDSGPTQAPSTPINNNNTKCNESNNDSNNNNDNNNTVLDFERYGDSFPLYHYNGLRGGTLTPFRVTRLSAEEAVGASIALNRGGQISSNIGGGSGDLEDVVRTKWPSSMINWLGKSAPYID